MNGSESYAGHLIGYQKFMHSRDVEENPHEIILQCFIIVHLNWNEAIAKGYTFVLTGTSN